MFKRSGCEFNSGHKKQQETTYPWIGVDVDSIDVDISVFLRDDGSVDENAMFEVVKEDLLMRHKSEMKWLRGYNCI